MAPGNRAHGVDDAMKRLGLVNLSSRTPVSGNSRSRINRELEEIDRRVRALLDVFTWDNFDSTSNKIIALVNASSEKEQDGRTLIFVTRWVYEHAIDNDEHPQVRDEGIRDAEGKPIGGGQLFKKYLLNRCQDDFERGWVDIETTSSQDGLRHPGDDMAPASKQGNTDHEGKAAARGASDVAAQNARRRGFGLIKFLCELFKLQMMTERVMHECVRKLLVNSEHPKEQDIESVCTLLTSIGRILDHPKALAHMDIYFSRMKEMSENTDLSAHLRLMLQDVMELRERRWVSRKSSDVPSTIAQLDENASREKAEAAGEAV